MASSSQDDYVVTDDWTPEQQNWADRDEENKRNIPPPIVPPPMQPEADFRDEKLEALINEGKLSEARKYLRDMIAVAREMNDIRCEANYEKYEHAIDEASMQGRRLSHTEQENGGHPDNDELIRL